MSLTTAGKTPGPVRFYLACDHHGCTTHTTFDLVIPDPGPSRDDDLWGHLLHHTYTATPHIKELGWSYLHGNGYTCPTHQVPALPSAS
ncbi:hypothetical protein [Streptomyces hiroshimensis]|uniref:Uncharacterized protein n=1 Tax=Streptomyces hiroshimensis TaxID=66424 RepID=A0ABQ2YM24_9ACTN|nr:hypothetical protein [Streptomyces hiroshimensis]GGX86448.1 hypothetical protein GCM10010324_34950 [Streptomyces hiroshimensis]